MKGIPRIYWKIQRRILGNFEPSQKVYEAYIKRAANPDFVWLDLGCGHQLFRSWRDCSGQEQEREVLNLCEHIYGLDYDFDSLLRHKTIGKRIRGDITRLPFKNESFDLITSNMVVEHLDDPKKQLREVYRVLKDRGLFLFHTPNAFSYTTILPRTVPESLKKALVKKIDGRQERDVFATYYRVNTEKTVMELAKEAGFAVRELELVVDPVAVLARSPVIAVLELLYIKLLTTNLLKKFRTNIICILGKEVS